MQTRLVIVNQGGGILSRELVHACADALGPVTYLSSDNTLAQHENVHSIMMPAHNNVSALARVWGWLSFVTCALLYILIDGTKAPMLLVSNPPLTPIIGIIARKAQGRPYYLLVYDVYPEALEQFGGLSRNSFVARLWRKMNQHAVRHAAAVVTLSSGMAATLAQYAKGSSDLPVMIIPTWVDRTWIRPIPKAENPFAQQYDQVDKLTVLYSGNIGRVHDLSMLPLLARQVQDYATIHFLVIGDGAGRDALVNACKKLNLQNVTFLPFQEESMLPYTLATADISIVAVAESGESISMPSKTYYAMAAGSALLGISRNGSDLERVIREHNCGVNVEPGQTNAAAQALVDYVHYPERLVLARKRARTAAETYYDRQVVAPKLIESLRSAFSM